MEFYHDAILDAEWSEKFLKAGIRTSRVVAISALEQIVEPSGKVITVNKLRKNETLFIGEQSPVVSIRAFGTQSSGN